MSPRTHTPTLPTLPGRHARLLRAIITSSRISTLAIKVQTLGPSAKAEQANNPNKVTLIRLIEAQALGDHGCV